MEVNENGQNEDEQEVKLCGFDKQPCIKEKCVHWTRVVQGSPMGLPVEVHMCVFEAILRVTGSPKLDMRVLSNMLPKH